MQLLRDLLVRETARDREQHLFLAVGERLARRARGRPQIGEAREQARGDRRCDERLAAGCGADRRGEQRGARVLQAEAAGACLERGVHELVEIERRDHDDRDRVAHVGPREKARGLDAIHHRHADVEQTHVGAERARELDRSLAVGCLGDHHDVGLGLEDHAQARPHKILIVGDESAEAHARALSAPRRGSTASTTHPPAGEGPASRRPASKCARSFMPTKP
jgi:hypothetical protein